MEYLFIFIKWKRNLLKHPSNTLSSSSHNSTFSTIIEECRIYFPTLWIAAFDSYCFYSLYSTLSCFLYTISTNCNLKAFLTIFNYKHTEIKIEDANGSAFSSE